MLPMSASIPPPTQTDLQGREEKISMSLPNPQRLHVDLVDVPQPVAGGTHAARGLLRRERALHLGAPGAAAARPEERLAVGGELRRVLGGGGVDERRKRHGLR